MRPTLPENYHVEYWYSSCTSRRPPKGETECVETLATSAAISDDKGCPVARGVAIRDPDEEVFSLALGREVALGRALKELETGIARGPFITPSGRVVTDTGCWALADEATRSDRWRSVAEAELGSPGAQSKYWRGLTASLRASARTRGI